MAAKAKSPPARPHIGLINPSSRFSSYASAVEWGEDDAWDSTSDSESPKQLTAPVATSTKSNRDARSPATTAPRPIPKTARNSSSASSLAFSYTHVNAPSPSSYPPRTEEEPEVEDVRQPKSDWTMVRKAEERSGSPIESSGEHGRAVGSGDADDDILELEFEGLDLEAKSSTSRAGKEMICPDAEEIVKGM